MKKRFRSHAPWLATLALTFLATPVIAQVPQDTTFTGRLVDNLGDPLAGPANLELRVFDADTGGTQLYSEQHLGVPLDATGGFSVQLGLGTSPSGTFDANLFSGVDRWLEVVVGVEVLTPRQIIGSVPWALIAQQANEIVPDPNAPRFEDCGDGTVADHQTGLQWEQKTGTVGNAIFCETSGCPDPHVVNNSYRLSITGPGPDGGAFTDFLEKLNGLEGTPFDCFLHCDWRLPVIGELRTIMIGPHAAPGQATTCSSGPCIDPDFAAIGGPTASSNYWSTTTNSSDPNQGWNADFNDGSFLNFPKTLRLRVRAVRAGSCH